MVKNKITIERECEHKIILKQGLIVIITVSEFIHTIDDYDKVEKYASTNVSLVNNDNGPILSKIGCSGSTINDAYDNCIEKFNRNINYFKAENEILLCCHNVPIISKKDLQDFYLTRMIKFSWINELNTLCLLTVYVRKENECFLFIYDGADEIFSANSDEEIIKHILNNCNFDTQPKQLNNKRKGKLFYPTIKEFTR